MPEQHRYRPNFLSFRFLGSDIPSGLIVFLVALPLCLGIAVASGAPPFAGLITGIIGGLVVAVISGSQVAVSGPAAGLTLIVLAAIEKLGYPAFLAAVVAAGVLQLIMGILKAGSIGNYFPSSVIKGMLAAIGLTLILKQIPHAIGYDADFQGDFAFSQPDKENTFSEIFIAINKSHLGAAVIALVSLILLVVWDRTPLRRVKLLPSAMVVVLLGIGLNALFAQLNPNFALRDNHLVNVPVINSFEEAKNLIQLPDFKALVNFSGDTTHSVAAAAPNGAAAEGTAAASTVTAAKEAQTPLASAVWMVALTLAVVASLETLLSLEAVDKLDPMKRNSPPNRELIAQGIGNITAGMLGGLPMTAVIVRGSVNVNSGAKTKTSAFFHGLFLLLSVMTIPMVINQIPYASLAAILLVTGYKLAKVSLFKGMYKLGWDQFVPFVVTVAAILFIDLLWGIAIGLAVAIIILLHRNMRNSAYLHKEEHGKGDRIKIQLAEEVSFLNKGNIRMVLDEIPDNSHVTIDGTNSEYIDYDVLEVISDFKQNALSRGIHVELIGIKEIYPISAH